MATLQDVNVRNHVIKLLTPLLPPRWKLYPYNTNLDQLGTTPVVILTLEEYRRHTTQGFRLATFTLTLIQPKIEPGKADDALDDDVIDLLNAIDKLAKPVAQGGADSPLTWTTAKRGVAANGNNPGFDIALQIPISIQPN